MKLVSMTTRYSMNHTFFVKKFKKMKKIVKIVAFLGNSGIKGGDGDVCLDGGGDAALNSNHWGTGRGKKAGDLGERVPWVPLGIPIR